MLKFAPLGLAPALLFPLPELALLPLLPPLSQLLSRWGLLPPCSFTSLESTSLKTPGMACNSPRLYEECDQPGRYLPTGVLRGPRVPCDEKVLQARFSRKGLPLAPSPY